MAAALMNQKGFEAKSAGIFASNGSDASPHTKQVLSENEIALTHTSQTITPELVDWATHIFTMTESHKGHLTMNFPYAQNKIFSIKEYVEEKGDVIDPFGGDMEDYRLTYSELSKLIEKAIKKFETEQ